MSAPHLIIGGGVLGLATAYALTRAGQPVVLIEADRIASGTTGASFGWINASTKTGAGDYHRLNAAGVAGWQTLARDLGPDLGHRTTGSVQIVAGSDAPGRAALDRDLAILSDFGYPARVADRGGLAGLEPTLHLPQAARAMVCDKDAVLDAPRAVRCLAHAAGAAGAKIIESRSATSLVLDAQGRIDGVETTAGPIKARTVLICAGIRTPDVLAALTGFDGFRTRFPLRQVPGVILQTPPLPDHLRPKHILWTSTTDELHVMPTRDGGLRIGSDEIDRYALTPTPEGLAEAAARLIDRAHRWLPGLAAQVAPADCAVTVGIRPYPEDGRTLAGPVPGAEGLFLAVTHSGITLAPVIGAGLAAMMMGGRAEALAPFGLSRLPGFQS